MQTIQHDAIVRHGNQLLSIFPNARERDALRLCKKLRRLEKRGESMAVRSCNGPQYREGELERAVEDLLRSVNTLLGNINRRKLVPILVNLDPRGYALKIDDSYVREHGLSIQTDWGGYGILAPKIES